MRHSGEPDLTRLDRRRLLTWMNSRKMTPSALADRMDATVADVLALSSQEDPVVASDVAEAVARGLDVDVRQIAWTPTREPSYLLSTAAELRASCRPIERDGIHFYNYYTLPAPHGSVGPVILDILCPAGRLPKLNNGHLEPALTVNLGPGDIVGRWAEPVDDLSFQVIEANHGDDPWIVGASYLEPSYAPHSYALATAEPAQIVSYTAPCTLVSFLDGVRDWPDASASRLIADLADDLSGRLVGWWASRRGYDLDVLAEAANVDPHELASAVGGGGSNLTLRQLRDVAAVLDVDYRLLLPPERDHDALGRSIRSVDESRGTIRPFRSYTVASMATASHLTDLTGCFMSVGLGEERSAVGELDLSDHAATHYLVVEGAPVFRTETRDGVVEVPLAPHDSLWVAPFARHRFSGGGAVLKFGGGGGFSCRDQFEISNTFASRALVERSTGEASDWGYDS